MSNNLAEKPKNIKQDVILKNPPLRYTHIAVFDFATTNASQTTFSVQGLNFIPEEIIVRQISYNSTSVNFKITCNMPITSDNGILAYYPVNVEKYANVNVTHRVAGNVPQTVQLWFQDEKNAAVTLNQIMSLTLEFIKY